MDYNTFLNCTIDEGIKGATADYKDRKDKDHLEGSIAGFEACRNLSPDELRDMFKTAHEYVDSAYRNRVDNYWYFRCYQLEIEWVLNVVSAMLMREGKSPLLSHLPTANGMRQALLIIENHH